MIFAILFFIHSVSASFIAGSAMPDGKVDKVVQAPGQWHGPLMGADLRLTLQPQWSSLHDWNDASLGLGLTYWNLQHPQLGHAIAPYIYMDVPLVRLKHFHFGLRPAIGAAFVTRTYRNTVPPDQLFLSMQDANSCIGSVTNLYFPESFYLAFPIAHGWTIDLAAGWYHISNGSTRQPNSGYNIFGAELGVKKVFQPHSTNHTIPPLDTFPQSAPKRWSIALGATAGGRQVYYRDQQTFAVASLHLSAYWHAHKIFRLGGGADIFYDGAYIPRHTYFGKTNLAAAQPSDCWRMGLSIQPEFVVGHFTAGLHLGAYIYDPIKNLEPKAEAEKSPSGRLSKPLFYAYDLLNAGSAGYPDGWLYTSVVLRYHLPWHIYLQAMMKSHLTKVEFVSLGLGCWL